MLVIGLTGSIGMGKSTVARRFIANGIAVFDADAVVHELYEGEAVSIVEAAFPGSTRDGRVDRTSLAQLLKKDKGALERLEKIVHPMVRDKREKFLATRKSAGAQMVVLEIPLLFETGGEKQVDVTVVVSAPADVQRARVLERPGMSEAKLDALLANQMPDAEKRRRADYVVDTDRPIEDTGAEIDKLIELLRGRVNAAQD
jgi:dephospho-CoA kinase